MRGTLAASDHLCSPRGSGLTLNLEPNFLTEASGERDGKQAALAAVHWTGACLQPHASITATCSCPFPRDIWQMWLPRCCVSRGVASRLS